ncbi:MAG: hypothetical protein APR53_10120 [Methanoculleus sp. SDB]|nr:MAG: hypothetical protein APR53_10120 [Methanoculleus sp. SDB]
MTEIVHLGVFSVAKVSAAIMMVIGLILGIIFLLLMILGGAVAGSFGIPGMAATTAGIIAIFAGTIGAAVGGFVYGAIAAFLFNVATGWFGGVEVEFRE